MNGNLRFAFPVLVFLFIAGCANGSGSRQASTVVTPATGSPATSDQAATSDSLNSLQATKDYLNFSTLWLGPAPIGAKARLGNGNVIDTAASPDGNSLAAVTGAGVYLYDAKTFSKRWVYPIHLQPKQIVFSPRGDVLAVGFHGGEIHLLNAESGTLEKKIQGKWKSLCGLEYSANGGLLAYCADQSVYLWDSTKEVQSGEYSSGTDKLLSFSISPDGTLLAVGYDYPNSDLRLVEANTGNTIRDIQGESGGVTRVAFSPDGKSIASEFDRGSVRAWDVATGAPLWEKNGTLSYNSFSDLAFSSDGKFLAVSANVDPLVVLDASSGKVIHEMNGTENDFLNSVSYSPAGDVLYASSDYELFSYSVGDGALLRRQVGYLPLVSDLAISPDGKTLAVLQEWISFWDMNSFIKDNPGSNDYGIYGTCLAYSPDGTILAVCQQDNTLSIVDTSSRQRIQSLSGHSTSPDVITFSPDGKVMASADNTIILWDTTRWTKMYELDKHTGAINDLAFSPDGKILASASADDTVRLWDVSSGNRIKILSVEEGNGADSVAFSPDGNSLFSFFHSSRIVVWDVATGKPLKDKSIPSCTMNTLFFPGKKLAYFPAGKLAVGCDSGDIVLWDPASDSIKTLQGHTDFITSIHLAPDGKTLVSGSYDGSVVVWNPVD